MRVLEYIDPGGRSIFAQWFESLDERVSSKVVIALTRIGSGNLSNVKGVGGGVQEYRIDFGPGYRIYFGLDAETIVILLGGGTKRRQQSDIEAARSRWADYKLRKKA